MASLLCRPGATSLATATAHRRPIGMRLAGPVKLQRARGTTTIAAAAAAAGGAQDDVSGAMLEPSVVNTPWGRTLGVAAAVAATAASCTVLPAQAAKFVELLAFSTLLGANVWTSFAAGIVMFKSMPRQMFGRVQSKLFPIYFALTTGASLVLLGGLYLAPGGFAAAPSNAVAALAACALGSLANLVWLEPKATTLMFERYDIENKAVKTEEDQASIKRLYKRFGMFHGISSLCNLVVLSATAAYGWILAGKLAL